MVQEYLPQAAAGDKRILLLEGEPLGAVNRVPSEGDFRGNVAAGGRVEKTEITEKERALCAALAPVLRQEKLYFVGIDVIGERLTEVTLLAQPCCGRSVSCRELIWLTKWPSGLEKKVPVKT
jgi:glutathione synthase